MKIYNEKKAEKTQKEETNGATGNANGPFPQKQTQPTATSESES
jgi:hypothetical protein